MYIEQVYLPGRGFAGWGESSLIIGPNKTTVLIDTGRDKHSKDIKKVLDEHQIKTIDWVILTHYHADHIGAFSEVFSLSPTEGKITINKGVISRGPVNLSFSALNESAFSSLCSSIQSGETSCKVKNLCGESNQKWSTICDFSSDSCKNKNNGVCNPTSSCPGLYAGSLESWCPGTTSTKSSGPGYIPLGNGAKISFYYANGVLSTPPMNRIQPLSIGHSDGTDENNRSLMGVVSYRGFYFVFGGDIEHTAEAYIAKHKLEILKWKSKQVNVLGWVEKQVDVIKLNHHGKDPVPSTLWIDWLLPKDNRTRNALVGSNSRYGNSPDIDVVKLVRDRLSNGFVWTPSKGALSTAGINDRLRDTSGPVVIRVPGAGDSYNILSVNKVEKSYSIVR